MCGITGVYCKGRIESRRAVVQRIIQSQYARGPDYQAMEEIASGPNSLLLGHDRLSIIDLSAQANQPMWDVDHTCCVVFNGEVFNYVELRAELAGLGHRFATQSDTEVILEAFKEWGFESINRFNGMFALGLFDVASQTLWLVRDRFGIKPLYYFVADDAAWFASSGTVLAEHFGLEPNLEYVARGLNYWFCDDDSDITAYRGLQQLSPGCALQVTLSEDGRPHTELRRYYDLRERVLPLRDELAGRSMDQLEERVAGLLEDSIDLRLRADVPVGISLSGGLDSSTVAAFLARKHPDVTGLTFGRPDEAASEGPMVAQLCAKTGIKVEYVWPPVDEIVAAFWETLAAQDAPFLNGSIVAQHFIYKTARERELLVMLGGQGGDEALMGYRKFQVFWFRQLLRERRLGAAARFGVGLSRMLLAELGNFREYWSQRRRYLTGEGMQSSLNLPSPPRETLGCAPGEAVWERQVKDVTRISLPTLLRYEDRNSMSQSVESRLPFMDYRLVETALALPERAKLANGYGKWITRRIVKGMIPETIRTARYKRGFDVSEARWVVGGLGDAIRTGLHERYEAIRRWLKPETSIEGSFSDEQLSERRNAIPEAISLLWLGDRAR